MVTMAQLERSESHETVLQEQTLDEGNTAGKYQASNVEGWGFTNHISSYNEFHINSSLVN